MIILHAGWIEEELWFWGEIAAQKNATSSTRSIKQDSPPPLPYDAGFKQLTDALKTGNVIKKAVKNKRKKAVIWVPTKGQSPLPSHRLIPAVPTAKRKGKICPWSITAYPVDLETGISFLSHCAENEMVVPGILVGQDVKFWAKAFAFARGQVIHQQFLPDLKQKDNCFIACWTPLFAGEYSQQFHTLAKTMPGACRAISLGGDRGAETSPKDVLYAFLQGCVDRLVRLSFGESQKRSKKRKQEFDSIHEEWFHALQAPDGRFSTPGSEKLQELHNEIQSWKQPIAAVSSTPFRLCFRVEEPKSNTSPRRRKTKKEPEWTIQYVLEDVSDPSLLISAKEVWHPKTKKAKRLQRPGFSAKEYLLYSLGQASAVCSLVEESLMNLNPTCCKTDTAGAYQFMRESAYILSQMGFGIITPSWWTGKGTRQTLSLSAKVNTSSLSSEAGLSMNALLGFEWQVALGDQEISLEELQELAKLKTPLVKMRGEWVHLDPTSIPSVIEHLQNQSNAQASERDLIQMALGRAKTPSGLAFQGVKADGWLGDLLAQLEGNQSFTQLEPHDNFHGELRPYQARGYSWLAFLSQWGLGACLADDMGLGKTIQTLSLIQNDWHANGKKPVLIVCPTSVVSNWGKEAERFTPELPVQVHHGVKRKKGDAFQASAKQQAIILTSYALLHRDIECIKSIEWRAVILDEAQNIKNHQTKQSKAARSLPADYRIALTGTPVENHVAELWSIMEFLNPGWLGSYTQFKKEFFLPIQVMKDRETAHRLQRLTGPFILRRLKTDTSIISDLPEKMEMKVFCNLTKEQASLYTSVVNEVSGDLEKMEGIQRKGLVLSTIMKLKQICNHPTQLLKDNSAIPHRSGKLERLTGMIEEILGINENCLIFSQFTEMGAVLQTYLQEQFGCEVLFLHGGVTKKNREQMVDRFQSEEGPNIFILSLKAGGTGLNLTQASHVFHFDRWWNPAVENQATDRAFRIGQTKNVQVHKFLCAGTFEERIDEMIESKKAVAENVVGSGESWLTELSTAELKDLMALRREEAVV